MTIAQLNTMQVENITIQFADETFGSLDFPTMFVGTDCPDQETLENYICNAIYSVQGNNPNGDKFSSEHATLSVGDLVWIDDTAFMNDSTGWRKLTTREVAVWAAAERRDRRDGGYLFAA